MTGYKPKFIYEQNAGYVKEMIRVTRKFKPDLPTQGNVTILRHIDGSITFVDYEDYKWTFVVEDKAIGYWSVYLADIQGNSLRIKKELILELRPEELQELGPISPIDLDK